MAGQLWTTDTLGGFMYSDELSDVLRTELQPITRFRNFCDIQEGKGESRGEKLSWNVYSDAATPGGQIPENSTMPETNYTITQESLTVTEYGNAVPYTGKLDALSKHDVQKVIHKVLKNDARSALDAGAHAEFDKTMLVVAPTGGTATDTVVMSESGSTAITNNVAMGKDHVKAIVDQMKERNITPYDGSNYCALGRPTTFRTFKDDLEAISIYTESGFAKISNGEIGRYEGTRFFEQTNVDTESWTNSKSDAAYFFGADTVAEGLVIPEEIRAKIPGDFGRSKGIAWYYLGGFGICHTEAANSRIVKWDSAA